MLDIVGFRARCGAELGSRQISTRGCCLTLSHLKNMIRGRSVEIDVICLSVFLFAVLGTLSGCTTHAKRLANPRSNFYANDLDVAHRQLNKMTEKPKSDASVVELDLAMVELFQGDLQTAEQRLRNVRDIWEEMERQSLAETAASYLTDDSRRAYSGEDYERILLRVMLTLCSLMQDGADAESYSLQTLTKQQELMERAKANWDEDLPPTYCIPPVAPYLRGLLREATLSDYHEAAKYYQRTASLLPGTPFLAEDIHRAQHDVHSDPGSGVVYVIALVGRGPYKEEVSEPATRAALQVADTILSAVGEYSVPPTIAPVKVPQIVSPVKPFDLVGVEVNGTPVSTTFPLTDLHQLAVDSYASKRPQVIGRAVARRMIKKGTIYAAKDEFEVNSDLASLAMDAAGVLWEATESADTRCWGLLPREIQILRIELPAGTHELQLEPVTAGRPVANAVQCRVPVTKAKNTYVLSYWPDQRPIGKVLVSQ